MTDLETVNVEAGAILAFGGTNARFGFIEDGDLEGYASVTTPEHPREFFGWMARRVLNSAENGSKWLVAGFPGPVSDDGRLVGPMANVPGLAKDEYDLAEELAIADPAAGRLLNDDNFTLIAVNDGELAAQAAADRIGEYGFDVTAALIIGTGVGAGFVRLDKKKYEKVCRADRSNPAEIGHASVSLIDPTETFENTISGPALKRKHNMDPRDMPADHPAWIRVADYAGQMATTLGLMHGANLVVPCGGVGSGGSEKYGPHLREMIKNYRTFGNATQNKFLPEIKPVPAADCQVFEMYGAEGVMRDFTTRTSTNTV